MKVYLHDKLGFLDNVPVKTSVNESNTSEENRINYVTSMAAVSRGQKESKNPPVRYKALLKEAAGNDITVIDGVKTVKPNASRPLEFLPVVIMFRTELVDNGDGINEFKYLTTTKGDFVARVNADLFNNDIMAFSYSEDIDNVDFEVIPNAKRNGLRILRTNMRTLFNAGIPYEKIPYNTKEELEGFIGIRGKLPMWLWAQVPNTHTRLSKEAQSVRVTDEDEYWLPEDFKDRVTQYIKTVDKEVPNNFLMIASMCIELSTKEIPKLFVSSQYSITISQEEALKFFKAIGYKQEIYNRVFYYFKYKEFIITGWKQDPKVWQHLCLERSAYPKLWKNWTQTDTANVVSIIRKLVFFDTVTEKKCWLTF